MPLLPRSTKQSTYKQEKDFPMSTQHYVTPDFALVRDSRESIRYQSIVGSSNLYIKALSNELVGLNAAVSSTDQLVANAITSAITVLETEDLQENLEALAVLNAREADASVKNAIKIYSKTANQLMELCTDQISNLHSTLQIRNLISAQLHQLVRRFRIDFNGVFHTGVGFTSVQYSKGFEVFLKILGFQDGDCRCNRVGDQLVGAADGGI